MKYSFMSTLYIRTYVFMVLHEQRHCLGRAFFSCKLSGCDTREVLVMLVIVLQKLMNVQCSVSNVSWYSIDRKVTTRPLPYSLLLIQMASLLSGESSKISLDKPEEGGRWYFSREEIEENSPSRRDGIDWKKETYLRKSYCTFLQDLGMRLKV